MLWSPQGHEFPYAARIMTSDGTSGSCLSAPYILPTPHQELRKASTDGEDAKTDKRAFASDPKAGKNQDKLTTKDLRTKRNKAREACNRQNAEC